MEARARRRPQLRLLLLLLLLCGGCPRVGGCNETRMLEKLPRCGKAFADMMHKVDVWKWCNLSEFIVYYESFTNCTEVETNVVGCYWPNPLAQGFITGVHRQFFANCTVDRTHWEDPPDEANPEPDSIWTKEAVPLSSSSQARYQQLGTPMWFRTC
ncbi:receptor activity-modifying protein 3 isoform X1 [Canis lupus baileyi]|uniref:receptor activity-modifying protein 3 isoform X1 n=1 Tax=Canis lupus baileyi TaxID=143281 RepID=UPI003B9747AE